MGLDLATTVLIVDDHPGFRSSARMLLEAEGFEVVGEAADGRTAISAARDLEPDVVLLDVQLPDLDGFEVSARLTANGARPAVVHVEPRRMRLRLAGRQQRRARVHPQVRALRRGPGGAAFVIGLRRALIGLGVAALVFGLALVAIIAASGHTSLRGLTVALVLITGWGFIGAGLFAWWRRPENNFGPFMVFIGFIYFVSQLFASEVPLIFATGHVLGAVFFVAIIRTLLAMPSGRLRSRAERGFVVGIYAFAIAAPTAFAFFADPDDTGCDNCPRNVLLIDENEDPANLVDLLSDVIAVGLTVVAPHGDRPPLAKRLGRRAASAGPRLGAGLGRGRPDRLLARAECGRGRDRLRRVLLRDLGRLHPRAVRLPGGARPQPRDPGGSGERSGGSPWPDTRPG